MRPTRGHNLPYIPQILLRAPLTPHLAPLDENEKRQNLR
jgi:hypothetical protein